MHGPGLGVLRTDSTQGAHSSRRVDHAHAAVVRAEENATAATGPLGGRGAAVTNRGCNRQRRCGHRMCAECKVALPDAAFRLDRRAAGNTVHVAVLLAVELAAALALADR